MKNISLSRFRDDIIKFTEAVEVSRKDSDGNIQLLGFWTPYVRPGAAELLEVSIVTTDAAPGEMDAGGAHGFEIKPKVIRTPEEAKVAVASDPVRAFPKDRQIGRKKHG